MSAPRILSRFAATLALIGGLCTSSFAFPVARPDVPEMFVRVDGNCYAIGQKMAAQKGGELMQANESSRGGKTVCHIVIRIPGNDGKRPRRAEFNVPAN